MIRHSLELAQPGAFVRLRVAGGQVRPHFVSEPAPDDEVVDVDGLRVFVAGAIASRSSEVVIDATEEHGNLVVRS